MTGFTSKLLSWKLSTRLALCHNNQAGSKILDWLYVTTSQARSTVLVSSQHLVLCHNTQAGSKILDSLYVIAVKPEGQY
jgi:hypothetical protein